MSDSTLFDTVEYRGLFWLPATPNEQRPGTVRFADKKIELEILGTFSEPSTGLVRPMLQPECILGVTVGRGDKLTLYDCHETSVGTGTGVDTSTIRVGQ